MPPSSAARATRASPLAKPAAPPLPSPVRVSDCPSTTSDTVTAPVKRALTGPTFCTTAASNPSAAEPVISSQPGTQTLSTSGFRIAAQTVAGSAAIRRLSVICMAMGPSIAARIP